ncbi:hypothetical protein DJICPGNB_08160 [Escherichia coli]|nr:hypothetical protein DJICPGNB_08160 [Escherichia coli]
MPTSMKYWRLRSLREILLTPINLHTSGTLRKTAVIDTHSPPIRLMVLCLGDTAFNQLRITGAGRE